MIGKRIRLISTNEYVTQLKRGAQGTITDVTTLPEQLGGNRQIWIRWDNGSTLALIEGEDRYKILPE